MTFAKQKNGTLTWCSDTQNKSLLCYQQRARLIPLKIFWLSLVNLPILVSKMWHLATQISRVFKCFYRIKIHKTKTKKKNFLWPFLVKISWNSALRKGWRKRAGNKEEKRCLFWVFDCLNIHCKKRLAIFPSPAEMSQTKLCLCPKL